MTKRQRQTVPQSPWFLVMIMMAVAGVGITCQGEGTKMQSEKRRQVVETPAKNSYLDAELIHLVDSVTPIATGEVSGRAVWNEDPAQIPSGLVLGEKRGIVGVTAIVERPDHSRVIQLLTDQEGRFRVLDLPEGPYRIVLRHPLLQEAVEETTVKPRSVTLVTVGFRATPRSESQRL